MVTYRSPGVYKQEIFLKPKPGLQTGVPAFIGFAYAYSPSTLFLPMPVYRAEEFAERFPAGLAAGYLEDAVAGFFENGGRYCYVVLADAEDEASASLRDALHALEPLGDVDLIAFPDAMMLSDGNVVETLQKDVLRHCTEHGSRFALLDSRAGSTPDEVIGQKSRIAEDPATAKNGALYYPWIKTTQGRYVPSCGHIAGIFSRSDETKGYFKAPANEEVYGVVDIEEDITPETQDVLHPAQINCIRALAGRGIRLWGARTLSTDGAWRQINVRRLVLTVARWLDANMAWVAFEPSTPRLWVRIQQELSAFLGNLWQSGALKGDTADQAFFVKCDAETNTSEIRESGSVITEIGMAPVSPAEFIVVRIVHRQGGVDVS